MRTSVQPKILFDSSIERFSSMNFADETWCCSVKRLDKPEWRCMILGDPSLTVFKVLFAITSHFKPTLFTPVIK